MLPAPPGIGQLPDTAFTSIALQADGKIVVAGTQDGQLLLARFTPSGQFDRANFGTGGYVTTRLPLGGAVVGRVLVQPDGKILIIGYATAPNPASGVFNIALARFLPSGVLDIGFGEPTPRPRVHDGWTLISIGTTGHEGANDGVVDTQGRVITVGSTEIDGFGGEFLSTRCLPVGSLDQSFSVGSGSPGGWITTPVPGGTGQATACVLDETDSTLTVAGAVSTPPRFGFALVRYKLD